MKVSRCEKCRHHERRRWMRQEFPANYHPIGMTHAYGYCKKHRQRCLKVKSCGDYDPYWNWEVSDE